MIRRNAMTLAVILAASTLVVAHGAAAEYPDHPVRLITPYPPAGGADSAARIVANALSESMGTAFVVENRPGASGRIGTELAAKAPADGYTLLLGSVGPNAIIPSVYRDLPYDAIKSFAPISLAGTSAYALVVPASVPAKSVTELIALAKAQPGKLNFASTGNLGGPHLAGELLKALAGIKAEHIAYKGGGPMITALLGGEVTFAFVSLPTVAPHIEAGTLRVLAVTGRERPRSMPNVPTMGEFVKGYEVLQWYGVLAPANTPEPVVRRLNAEMVKAMNSPKVRESLARVDTEAATNSPEEFQALIRSELVKYQSVVEKAGIKPD